MSLGDRIRVPAATPRSERAPRGRVWLYSIAFGMLLIAGWLQVKGNLHSRLRLVWWSIGLSIGAALVAAASVLVRGRRLRTGPEGATSSTPKGTVGAARTDDEVMAPSEPDPSPDEPSTEPDPEPTEPENDGPETETDEGEPPSDDGDAEPAPSTS